MSKMSTSFTLGKASAAHGANVEHNNREFLADNIDANRIVDNITYAKQDVRETYNELFGKSLEEYNAKQKQPCRRISDYFEHISNGNVLDCKGYSRDTTTITHAIPLFATLSAILRSGKSRRKKVDMVKMTYHQWEKLSVESQNEYIKAGMLPDVPLADLENGLILSQMVIKDGERYWEIQYDGETETKIVPEYKQENELGVSVRCKFVPMCGHYLSNLTEVLGYYGMKWLDFMEENYPKLYRQLEKKQTLYAVAQSVNKYASDYKTLLDRQYESLHPRPYEWEDESEHRSWTFTRNFYTDHEVMVERVLIPHRTA